jgi:hypothetical protein
MRTLIVRIALVTAGLFACAPGLNAGNSLSLRVAPRVSTAPGYVVVTATVERNPDNRTLEIAAESDDFFRSSLIPLDGDHAPRITQMTLKDLPGGEYTVVVAVQRSTGERAVVQRAVTVMASAAAR